MLLKDTAQRTDGMICVAGLGGVRCHGRLAQSFGAPETDTVNPDFVEARESRVRFHLKGSKSQGERLRPLEPWWRVCVAAE